MLTFLHQLCQRGSVIPHKISAILFLPGICAVDKQVGKEQYQINFYKGHRWIKNCKLDYQVALNSITPLPVWACCSLLQISTYIIFKYIIGIKQHFSAHSRSRGRNNNSQEIIYLEIKHSFTFLVLLGFVSQHLSCEETFCKRKFCLSQSTAAHVLQNF